MSHRIERFSSTLKQSLADILLRDMDNPLLKFLFISDIMMSPDLKKARVFVSLSPLPGSGEDFDSKPGADIDELISQLTRAKGYIKRALAGRMYLKYVPELEFIKDEIIREQESKTSDE